MTKLVLHDVTFSLKLKFLASHLFWNQRSRPWNIVWREGSFDQQVQLQP